MVKKQSDANHSFLSLIFENSRCKKYKEIKIPTVGGITVAVSL